VLGETLENGPHCRGADDRLGRAVVDDVGGLGGGEVGVDRHVVQPTAAGGPHDRVEVLVVLHEHRDGVAFAKSGLPEQVRQLVGPRLHLAEGNDLAGGVEDHRGLVRGGQRMLSDLHA